ncbi:SLOG family protein [Anaerotardibacter muris]|uniref:SLOG family protein n=1 Tax=Anaerotardibacter muris TaxID=2941505 RepID=UPI00203C2F96|nr:SLOG family protein [Anaerotardibacter muris]
MSNDQAFNSADSSNEPRKEDIEALLDGIKAALENNPDCSEGFVNEFGDFTLAIPLNGGQKTLDNFMEKQELRQYLADISGAIASKISAENDKGPTCCFTGHRPKRVPWLTDEEDPRTRKLKDTLRSLIDNLSLHGVSRYIAGNAEGFDTIAAETVLESNEYLETAKIWDGVPEEWLPAELEIAIPFEGHNKGNQRIKDLQDQAAIAHVVSHEKSRTQAFLARDRYMVDCADIVVAFVDNEDENVEKSGAFYTIDYATKQRKTIILFSPSWFGNDWPNTRGIAFLQPE